MSLVRSHLSLIGCELWAPQGSSADLLRLEGIQRRATISFCFLRRPFVGKRLSSETRTLTELYFLWNNLPLDIKSSTSVSILKSIKLDNTFDLDRPRTWKTLCTSVVSVVLYSQTVVHLKCNSDIIVNN